MKKCNQCQSDAVIYMKDMREKKKTSILLCDKHFKQFCYGLMQYGK